MNEQLVRGQTDDSEVEIDLLDLLGFYLSHFPLLIGAVVIGALVAGLYTHFLIPDKFTASSRMYMVAASSDTVVNLSDLNLGTSLSNDYVELMKSRPVIEEVIEKLELPYDYNTVLNMISLSVVNNTRIVRISVTSVNPQEAMDIANQMARTARTQLPNVMAAPKPSIAEYAVLPQHRSSPSMKKNILIGAMLLLVLVLAFLTITYLMDDTIKTAEDVEKEFGIMPLSVIPEGEVKGLEGHVSETKKESRKLHRKIRKGTGK